MAVRGEADPVERWSQVSRLALTGPGGEPVDLHRVFASHGVARLPPQLTDPAAGWLLRTELLPSGTAARMRIRLAGDHAVVESAAPLDLASDRRHLRTVARRILNLDEDLSEFYARVNADPELSWAARGSGRLLRSPTVFEDVIKTLCTTNCSWGATVRMVTGLVTSLGVRAPDGSATFPTPETMAEREPAFYRDEIRAGYRAPFLHRLAMEVASGSLNLEELRDPELPDAEVRRRLLGLPGIGPYAAAHIMLIALGRYSELILDSWTRPKYARIRGRPASDEAIRRRFARFGTYRGLAFWLTVTADWLER